MRTGIRSLFVPRPLVLLAAATVALAPGARAAGEAPADAVHYRAPAVDPAPRRIGGVARALLAGVPRVEVLAPDHLGLTLSEQPTLHWFLSAPTGARIELVLIDPRRSSPLVEAHVAGDRAGIQSFDSGRAGVRLEPNVQYEWSVAVVLDPEQRSRDVVAGGAIMRVAPSDAQHDLLRETDPGRRAGALAAEGLWYDALATLSAGVAARPGDRGLRAVRAALLEQAGLAEVAAFDRAE